MGESDIRGRMQPLKDQLTNTINHLHTVFETHVFVAICRGYWDRMGQVSYMLMDLIVESLHQLTVLLFYLTLHNFFCYRMFLVSWRTGKRIGHGIRVHELQFL